MSYDQLLQKCGKIKIDKSMLFFTHPCGIQHNPKTNSFIELKDRQGNLVFRRIAEDYARKRIFEYHNQHPDIPLNTRNITVGDSCYGIECGLKPECDSCRIKLGCERKFNTFRI